MMVGLSAFWPNVSDHATGERKTLLTRQIAFEPLPAFFFLGVVVIWHSVREEMNLAECQDHGTSSGLELVRVVRAVERAEVIEINRAEIVLEGDTACPSLGLQGLSALMRISLIWPGRSGIPRWDAKSGF